MTAVLFWLALSVSLAGSTVEMPDGREVVFEDDAGPEIEGALADYAAGRFADAARRFQALADASRSAELRLLEATARYEAGELVLAERAAADSVARGGGAPAGALYGLVLADRGKGDQALTVLGDALSAAGGDAALTARVRINRGVVRLDRGEATLAEADFRDGRASANQVGDTALVALADENLALVGSLRGEGGGGDGLSRVADSLRKGDLSAAKAAVGKPRAGDRRGAARAAIATGEIARAEGRLDAAASSYQQALGLAREGGLVREEAMALASLGIVYGLGGRDELALDRLQEAIGLVAGTSFRVTEVACRVEAGRVAVRMDDLAQARAQLAAARKTFGAGVEDPLGGARLDELDGLISGRSDDVAGGVAALERALGPHESRGLWTDAARIATSIVELHAGRDESALAAARQRAIALFAKANDPVGPAHVGIAEGLGRYRRGDLDGALAAFVAAAKAGEAAGTTRGSQVAAIAKQDAAQALIAQGHSADVLARAGELDLEGAVRREQAFSTAEVAYGEGVAAFDAGRWDDARTRFDTAATKFASIGEEGYASQSRRGRAWSDFNRTVGKDPATALPVWTRLVEEGSQLRDPELRARAMGAEAIDLAVLGRPEALNALRAAAPVAEQIGIIDVAGLVWAKLADLETDLDARAAAARRAWELRPDKAGTYALYSVAVDAYNDEQYALAVELSDTALPKAGDLAGSVREVRDAARSALAE